MGKLHGLTIGLDVCSTLHMDVSLDDLDWCLEQIVPANPGYLMALPTKNDPMLSYLTTAFQDHVRLRETFGYKVDDRMWAFFQRLGVIDAQGRPTEHFGDPAWVYLQYRRHKGDTRPDADVLAEAARQMAEVRARGRPARRGPRREAVGPGAHARPGDPRALRRRQGRPLVRPLPGLRRDASRRRAPAHPRRPTAATTSSTRPRASSWTPPPSTSWSRCARATPAGTTCSSSSRTG